MRNLGADQRQESPADTTAVRPSPATPAAGRSTALSPAARSAAVLGPTLRFKGELSADEDFILQGQLEGSIHHTQSVTIGIEGSVLGNIHARVVTIDGSVQGDLHGSEAVIINATARVAGNIFAPRVGLVDGAFFTGKIEMPARPADGAVLSPHETARLLGVK
jgi:cytoskeletal protein CcmA (bactofilin family)